MPLDGPNAAFAETGDNASPSAQSTEISSRITCVRIGAKDYLSMNAGLANHPGMRFHGMRSGGIS